MVNNDIFLQVCKMGKDRIGIATVFNQDVRTSIEMGI